MLNPVKTSVLFVDDDVDDAELLRESLLEIEPTIQFKHLQDGWDAIIYLQKLKKNQLPQVIILDLNMRIINGFEFLRLVKNEPRFSHMPVVMYSTSYREKDRNTSHQLGANAFITKPVTGSDISAASRQILEFCFKAH